MPGSSSPRSGAGTFGALGVVLALTARRTTGRGQLVEVCLNETYLHLLTLPTVVAMYTGMDMPRMGDGYPYGIYRCADGYLGVSILTQPQWLGLCRLMDRADLADHPRFRTGVERADPAVAAELDAIITAWIAEQPAEDTFHAAQAMRVPIVIVPSPSAVLASAHYAARDYWVEVDDDELGELRLPSAPFRLASGALGPVPAGAAVRRRHRGDPRGGLMTPPLHGVRVLDLTAWQAGPLATMILGDFGAEVVKIEAPQRLDGWRGGAGLDAERMYERSPIWNAINRSKLGISLDLAAPEGHALFLRLVADADVVIENFTPRVMDQLGLGYDTLRAANPADRDGVALRVRPQRAVARLRGVRLPDRGGLRSGLPERGARRAADPDGRLGHRCDGGGDGRVRPSSPRSNVAQRTGVGDDIDLSQIETLTTCIAGELVQAQVTGADPPRRGNDAARAVPARAVPVSDPPATSSPSPCATTPSGSGCAV